MGVAQFIYIVLIFISALVFFSFAKHRADYFRLIFVTKDLPEVEEFKVGKNPLARIKLYGLNKDENGNINREDYYYALMGRIINAHMKYELNDENGIDVLLDDFEASELKQEFLDIMATCTNFDLRKFVFKGENKTKLYTLDNKVINSMKAHTHKIINEVYLDLIATIEENGMFGDVEIS
jgi:hypothetical protein